ncbi:CHAD domain-containing protein [Skermania sp. ID1734]|uniref:CHAD domain-containing protein n=1 Tax=Skermania sp. ID1734 TaxID=2597516 RepID=UPI0011802E56|nr:CHAD domain-containing protein [Skermania sp. ID1734]TSE01090.1 CHAD domain-containing protein [Skermania sp. ID1734]
MTTAGSAATAAVASDVERLLGAEPAVRQDEPDSVHQMRVATRRLRSVLRSYRSVFDKAQVQELRSELRWLAGILGEARDAEVMAERLETLLAAIGSDLIFGDITDRLPRAQRAHYTAAHTVVVDTLNGTRYRELRSALTDFIERPPVSARADQPAAEVMATALRKDYRHLRDRVRAEFASTPQNRLDALHAVRKAAKRLRYAAEAASPVLGEPAERVAGDAKSLQSVLGDHRDAAESQELILREAQAARAAGDDLFSYGVAYMAERQQAHRIIADYPRALEVLTLACAALGD